ncbi:MAG: YbjN domain-containing protein [Bacteroidia bacterium]
MNIEKSSELIESTFAFLGLNPLETRGAEQGQWVIYNGDTEIYIDIWEVEKENAWLYYESDEPIFAFQVISPICYLPESGLEHLYEELLHNNLNMLYTSYTINKEQNMLAVKYRRPSKGLTQEEIIESIESVGYYSESTYTALKDRYQISKIEAVDREQ